MHFFVYLLGQMAKLSDIEKMFITSFGKDPKLNPFHYIQYIPIHRIKLKEIRNFAENELKILDQQYDSTLIYTVNNNEIYTKLQLEKAQKIKNLFRQLAERINDFIRELIEECKFVLGNPPNNCEYAIIGLGSLARHEITPYSDLEFAILIDHDDPGGENKRYFRNLTRLLYFKIINLGETILPAMAIKSLNNFYSKDPQDNWFYDNITPRGFTFDGAMPWACKTPLGCTDYEGRVIFELIQTPQMLARNYRLTNENEESSLHLSKILTTSTLIIGNEKLHQQYEECVRDIFNQKLESEEIRKKTARKMLVTDVDEFNPKVGEYNEDGKLYIVKQEIYRLPSIIFDRLALYFDLDCEISHTKETFLKYKSTWDRIEIMARRHIIDESAKNNLLIIASISNELRLRAYLSNNGQREKMHVISSQQSTMLKKSYNIFQLSLKDLLFRYYFTVLPMHEVIEKFCQMNVSEQITDREYFKASFFDNSAITNGLINKRLLDYKQSEIYFKNALKEYIKKYGSNHAKTIGCINLLGEILQIQGNLREAKEHYELATTLNCKLNGETHSTTVSLLNNLGSSYQRLGDAKKALELILRALQTELNLSEINFSVLFQSLINFGSIYHDLGESNKSIKAYGFALAIGIKLYNKNDYRIAHVLNNLGLIHKDLGDIIKALQCYKHATSIWQEIYPEGHPHLAIAIMNLGLVYHKLGMPRKACSYYEQALSFRLQLFEPNHPEIANNLINIATAYSDLGQYSIAIEKLDLALNILNPLGKEHPFIADGLSNKGFVLQELGKLEEALACFKHALAIRQSLHSRSHYTIATILNNIGTLYFAMSKTNSDISQEHLNKALGYFAYSLKINYLLYSGEFSNYVTALCNIGSIFEFNGKIVKAIACFKLALELGGEAHPNRPSILNNLGSIYHTHQKNPKIALEFLISAINLKRKHLGNDHIDVATTLFNIGNAYQDLSDILNAALCIGYAYEIYYRVKSEFDSDTQFMKKNWQECQNEIIERGMFQSYEKEKSTFLDKLFGSINQPSLTENNQNQDIGNDLFGKKASDTAHWSMNLWLQDNILFGDTNQRSKLLEALKLSLNDFQKCLKHELSDLLSFFSRPHPQQQPQSNEVLETLFTDLAVYIEQVEKDLDELQSKKSQNKRPNNSSENDMLEQILQELRLTKDIQFSENLVDITAGVASENCSSPDSTVNSCVSNVITMPIQVQAFSKEKTSLSSINSNMISTSDILDVSGHGNNCGLFALALGIKLSLGMQQVAFNHAKKLDFLLGISEQSLQQVTSETPEVSKLLRGALGEALLQDAEFKESRLENFIATCVLYVKKGTKDNSTALLLDRNEGNADMEAFIRSNQSAMNTVWNRWFEIKKILQQKESASYINIIDNLGLTSWNITECYKAIAQLLPQLNKQNASVKIEQLLRSYDYPQPDPINYLLRLKKLFCTTWKKITIEGTGEQRKIFNDILSQFFQKHYISLLIRESDIGEISNKLFIFASLESINFDAKGKIINNLSFNDVLDTACSLLIRVEIKKTWENIYKDYVKYIKENPVMLTADELGCLATYWDIQLAVEFRHPIVRTYKTYEQRVLNAPHVTLCNLTEDHWRVVLISTLNVDILKNDVTPLPKQHQEETESIELYTLSNIKQRSDRSDVEVLVMDDILQALNHQSIVADKYQTSILATETAIEVSQQLKQDNQYYNKNLIAPLQFQELKLIITEIKSSQVKLDYALQAQAFIKLGDFYLKQKEYLYTASIYNYVFNIYCVGLSRAKEDIKIDQTNSYQQQKQNIINKLADLERQFITELVNQLQRATIDNPYHYLKSSTEHKVYLQKLREDCKRKLEKIDQQYPFDIYDEVKTREQHGKYNQLQLEKAELIHNLYNNITEQLKFFIRQLIQECIAVLGDPPCEYAVIGLGSLAREEATPYSDLEFAILIIEEKEDYKRYFRSLSKLLHLKVINLGETILPAMAIPALNNYYSNDPLDNWFYDNVTPRGFAFDGAMPQACKTPLGKRNENGELVFELIGTPEEIARFQSEKAKSKKQEYWIDIEPHLPGVLVAATFVCGREELLMQYETIVRLKLNSEHQSGKSLRVYITQKKLLQDIEEFDHKIADQSEEGKLYIVKKDLYRLIDRLISMWSLYYDIDYNPEKNSFLKYKSALARVEELYRRGLINQVACSNLKIAVSISIGMRLRAYLFNKGQYEKMVIRIFADKNGKEAEKSLKEIFELENLNILFRYYYTVLPLYELSIKFYELITKEISESTFIIENKFFLSEERFFNDSEKNRGLVYKRVLQYQDAKVCFNKAILENQNDAEAQLLYGMMLSVFGEYDIAEYHLKIAKDYYYRGNDFINFLIALTHLTNNLCCLNKYDEVVKYSQSILNLKKDIQSMGLRLSVATFYDMLAIALRNKSDFEESIKCHKNSLRIKKKIFSNQPHLAIINTYSCLGLVYHESGSYDKAIKSYQKSLKMSKEIYGEYPNPFLSMTWNNLGNTFGQQSKYDNAIRCYTHSILMDCILYRKLHLDMAISLNNIGEIYRKQSNYNFAMKYYQDSLKIKQQFLGDANHPGIAKSLENIGVILEEMKNYQEAMKYYTKSLNMKREIYSGSHPEIAKSLGNIGILYYQLEQFSEAKNNLTDALKIQEYIYKENSHPDMVSTLNTLGSVLEAIGDAEAALECYKKALKILGKFYPDMLHPDVAAVLCNVASCLEKTKDYEASVTYYQLSYEIFEKIMGINYEKTKKVKANLVKSSLKLGNLLILQGKISEAKKYYAVIGMDPAIIQTHQYLASLFYSQNKLEEVIEHYEILIKFTPTDSYAYHNLACLYHVQSNPVLSEKYFTKALSIKLSSSTLCDYGLLLLNQKRFEDAAQKLLTTLSFVNDSSSLMYGKLEKNVLDPHLQREIFDKSNFEISPFFIAHYWLIQCFLLLKDDELKSFYLDRFNKLTQQFPSRMHYRVLSYAYLMTANKYKAEECMALSLSMKDIKIEQDQKQRLNYNQLYLKELSELIEKSPSALRYRVLNYIYSSIGNNEKAQEYDAIALSLEPTDKSVPNPNISQIMVENIKGYSPNFFAKNQADLSSSKALIEKKQTILQLHLQKAKILINENKELVQILFTDHKLVQQFAEELHKIGIGNLSMKDEPRKPKVNIGKDGKEDEYIVLLTADEYITVMDDKDAYAKLVISQTQQSRFKP